MIKYQHQILSSSSQSILDPSRMANEEPNNDQNNISDHNILEWIEGTLPGLPFLPSIFDDPYSSVDFSTDPWWSPQEHFNNNNSNSTSLNSNSTATTTTATSSAAPPADPIPAIVLDRDQDQDQPLLVPVQLPLPQSEQLRKRKASDQDPAPPPRTGKKPPGKKGSAKSSGNNSNNSNKDGRWAEQLLNPCAAAITSSNPSRVQHLLYVINELASLTGDANHRLAAHGLRALTQHLASSPVSSSSTTSSSSITTFSGSNPKFFTESLINFSDINPWFRIPNSIANSSILQILNEKEQQPGKHLHIVDIGVSHGIQWPTLLEELSRRSGGPPPLVRITFIDGEDEQSPFAVSPAGYNCSSQLLAFAKKININLQINRLNRISQVISSSSSDETLIICAQFRLHSLSHHLPDERTGFLRALRRMDPKGVVLTENDQDCSCRSCVDFAAGFSRRVEGLWRFLDSASAAYKGRESDERRMMEWEAAKGLSSMGEMNERKEKWCERMSGAGFRREGFGEDAVDGARALLRKYDGNWEIKVEDRDGCVCLWWKGQPVSFCSLWKIDQAETK